VDRPCAGRARRWTASLPGGCAPRAGAPAISVVEDEVVDLVVERGSDGPQRCRGAVLRGVGTADARAVVLASGTFLGGVLHVGERQEPGGRRGERASSVLAETLRRRGLPLGRFKTGTPPRLLRDSIDWAATEVQEGDASRRFFCPDTRAPSLRQVPCHGLYTNPRRTTSFGARCRAPPLWAGGSPAAAAYCPSFEEKVTRFATATATC